MPNPKDIKYIVKLDIDGDGNGSTDYEEFNSLKDAKNFLAEFHVSIRSQSKIYKAEEVTCDEP